MNELLSPVLTTFLEVEIDYISPWSYVVILISPLIVGIVAGLKVLNVQHIKKAATQLTSRKNSDKKNPGDERLQTDDLLLNDASTEAAVASSKSNAESSDSVQQEVTTIDSSSNKTNDSYNDESKFHTAAVDADQNKAASLSVDSIASKIQPKDDIPLNEPVTPLICRTPSTDSTSVELSKALGKKSINEFTPTFFDQTSDRMLNIGRPDENKKAVVSKNLAPFIVDEKPQPKADHLTAYPNIKEKLTSKHKMTPTPSAGAIPQLVCTPNYNELNNRNFGFTTMESFMNVRNCMQRYGHKFEIRKVDETKVDPKFKINPLDTINPLLPGYKPLQTEKDLPLTIPTKDLISPVTKASNYETVPGPVVLKTIGQIWKYIPMLGTQFVATFMYAIQSFISSYDRQVKYSSIYPYFYLFNKYGPMVKLNSPLGADILLLAVNGLDFPLIHTKIRENKVQSLFDSLNTYRKDAPAIMTSMAPPNFENSKLPGNPTLTIDKYYSSIEKITDHLVRREGKFMKGHSGADENENHENDLVKWALQCTMDVYFKSNRNLLDDSSADYKLFESFQKASKSVSLSETGIQLWRFITTFAWLDLVEYCKCLDKYIADDAMLCLAAIKRGKTTGSVLEFLFSSEELNTSDILTPLLDLLIINVNLVASTAGFLLYYLGKNPQVQRNVYREIRSVLPKGGGEIPQEDLNKLKYLNACIVETLRLVPPLPVLSRELEEDTNINGFHVPRGTFIQMVNVLPCLRGDVVYDEVGKFQAERWTENGSQFVGDPFAVLPQWDSFPNFNRDLVITQIALLAAKIIREHRIDDPQTEIYTNGMVLAGPSTPFNFTFLERII